MNYSLVVIKLPRTYGMLTSFNIVPYEQNQTKIKNTKEKTPKPTNKQSQDGWTFMSKNKQHQTKNIKHISYDAMPEQ